MDVADYAALKFSTTSTKDRYSPGMGWATDGVFVLKENIDMRLALWQRLPLGKAAKAVRHAGGLAVVNKADSESLSVAQLRRLLLGDVHWPIKAIDPDQPGGLERRIQMYAVLDCTLSGEYRRYIVNAEFREATTGHSSRELRRGRGKIISVPRDLLP